uniref:CSON005882 protein n=1 Tax=Culicoides sonorensis TaxID=179676 RepID=A0A336M7P3_CULSO
MQSQMRRPSLAKRRISLRRSSLIQATREQQEVPWDLFDRLLLPIICCQAAAIILSGILNVLRISQVSAFALFLWFVVATIGAVLFYHHLKVSAPGKAVLITGCDSPLAWRLARKLDEIGFAVFAAFPKLDDCSDAELLKDECSGRLKLVQLDVTSEVQMLEASLYIAEHLPDGATGLWGLIHCESFNALGELEWIPFPVLRKALDVNVLGASRLTQIMLPLIRRAHGRVIFLSSALAKIPSPVRGAHCATQAAVESLASCLKEELRPRNVDVVVVAAGEFAAGAAWLSDETMIDQAKQMWKQLSEEQRHSYGEDYFEAALRSLEKYTEYPADLTPVVRCLVDATTRTFPLQRYTPVTRSEKIRTFSAEYFPRTLYDVIYKK